jgi:hypothetical protein
MVRHLPVVLGIVAIIGLTVAEARISGRFQGSDITEEQFAELLKNVPSEIGDWQGTNLAVEDQVKKTAGARGYVSREYTNVATGETVTVWLIVGHSRDVMRHTPDICYPSSGFITRAPENARVPFVFENQPEADFYTNTFIKEDATGRRIERVFWAWYKPNEEGTVQWEAPKIVRLKFGNARSLYKLYFSSGMRDYGETADQSPCMKFAEVFLPVVDRALSTIPKESAPREPAADAESSDDSSTT